MGQPDHGLLLGLTDNDHPQYADGWGDWVDVNGGVGYSNSWVDYSAGTFEQPSYRKHSDGMVQVRGLMKDGTINTTAFTLPTGYRPPLELMFAQIDGNHTARRMNMLASGAVVPQAGANGFFSVNFLFDSTGGS